MAFTQDNNDEDQQGQNAPLMTGGGQGSLNQGIGNAPVANTAQQNRQGSGRFTNMNKYVQANQQGSANLASRIGSGIQSQLSNTEADVGKKIGNVTNEVGIGQNKVSTASTKEQDLKSIGEQFKAGANFNILSPDKGLFSQGQQKLKSFSQAPDYKDFKTFQSGEAINEKMLNDLQQQAAQGSTYYQDLFKQRQAQVGNTQGREQALQEFIGGANQAIRPAYSSGQRKLDQLVLGQNRGNLQNLINTVGANQANVNQTLANVDKSGQSVSDLAKAETDLINLIQGTAGSTTKSFQDAFNQEKLDQVNAARKQSYDDATSQLYSGEFKASDYDKLGLNALGENTATFNLIDELKSGNRANEFINKRADVLDTKQLGRAEDVESDALLADILGAGATRKLTQVGDLNTDYLVNQADGKSALAQAIQNRQQQELADAQNTGLSYEGKDSYWDWGSKKEKRQTSHGTVAELLGGGFSSYGDRGDVRQGAAQDVARYFSPLQMSGGGPIADAANNLVNNLSGAVMGNQSGGAADAAYRNSVQGLYGQLQQYIQNRGYGKGIKKV
jgi:hypothetical protein